MPTRSQRPLVTSEAPRELVFFASRSKAMLVLILGLVFGVGGYYSIPQHEIVGWLGLLLGGFGSVAGLLLLLFPQLSSLELTTEGFTIRGLFGSSLTRWQDVTGFMVVSVSMNKMVVFNYAPGYSGKRLQRKIASDLAGWEGSVADMYGIAPADLADLMNAWKRQSDLDASAPNEEME